MRSVAEPQRSPRWYRLAMFAAISVAAAGCSAETGRFDSNPFSSGSAPASNEVTGSVVNKSSNVQSTPLPPPSTASMQRPATRPVAAGTTGGSGGMASYRPPSSRGDVTGSVHPVQTVQAKPRAGWTWEGGTPVTTAPGDTADTLARRYGVPASAIIQANKLPNGNAIRPGQRLVIPRYESTSVTGSTRGQRTASNAPQRPAPTIGAPATTGNHVHVIAPGETLMMLSRRYHKSLSEIARANNIPPHTMVKIGDRISIPGVRPAQTTAHRAQPKPVAPKSSVAGPVAHQAKPAPAPAPKVAAAPATTTARMVTPAAHQPAPEKAKSHTASTAPTFRWPVRGRVINAFGPRPSGQQNDGINVAVPEGTPVKAAEDGVVAYAGNELKTYGNLVLVRHSNGYVTAYAHASEIMVKRDDPIKRGQVIAKAGQTGSVAAPQLHFEIRKGSTPVDPLPYLDKGGSS